MRSLILIIISTISLAAIAEQSIKGPGSLKRSGEQSFDGKYCEIEADTLKDNIGYINYDEIFKAERPQEFEISIFEAGTARRTFSKTELTFNWSKSSLVKEAGEEYRAQIEEKIYSDFANSYLQTNSSVVIKTDSTLFLCDLLRKDFSLTVSIKGSYTYKEKGRSLLTEREISKLSKGLSSRLPVLKKAELASNTSAENNERKKVLASALLGVELGLSTYVDPSEINYESVVVLLSDLFDSASIYPKKPSDVNTSELAEKVTEYKIVEREFEVKHKNIELE